MLASKRRPSVFPCAGPLYFGELNQEQSSELEFLVSRYAPTHFVSCESLKKESVTAAQVINSGTISSLVEEISGAELVSTINSILESIPVIDSACHDHLNFHTILPLLFHFMEGKLELTNCSSCGSIDIRLTGDDNRLQKCGVCKFRKRKAQKLAVRLSSLGMRNDSINVLCENLVGNHILRTISRDFVGGGGITGRRPTDPQWYILSATRALQSSVLGKIFVDLDLVNLPISIENGHLFAVAFETFGQRFLHPLISVDRAFSLLMMMKMKQVVPLVCTDCGAMFVHPVSGTNASCYYCEINHQADIPIRKSNRHQYEPLITLEE